MALGANLLGFYHNVDFLCAEIVIWVRRRRSLGGTGAADGLLEICRTTFSPVARFQFPHGLL